MKTFYTERDIEDLYATGVTEIEINDEVVLTDLAREKAMALGLQLKPAAKQKSQTAERMLRAFGAHLPAPAGLARPAASSSPQPDSGPAETDLVQQVKAAVIARLGTDEYNGLLDQVIPQILARLQTNRR